MVKIVRANCQKIGISGIFKVMKQLFQLCDGITKILTKLGKIDPRVEATADYTFIRRRTSF